VAEISASPCAAETKPCFERRRRQVDTGSEHAVEKALELLDVAARRRRVARHFGRVGEKETEHSADVIRRQR
jgi:hypothetical protein